MKKYISFIAIALVAVFTSCSNEDVTIKRAFTFKVNPYSVISSFPEEWPGELTSFDSSLKLRIRLLVYNENGNLVFNESSYLSSYSSEMSVSKSLATGTYTLIATTDLVPNSGTPYWTLSDENNINTASITTENIHTGGKNKILGFCSQKVTITESSQSITLSPTPAGALVRMYYNNVFSYSNVKYYALYANRASYSMSFDANGNPSIQPHVSPDGKLDVICSVVDVDNAEGNNLYSWYFIFPVENVTFRYIWESRDEVQYWMGEQFTIPSIKAGEEWLLEVDCETDINNQSKYEGVGSRQLESRIPSTVPTMIKKVEQAKVPSLFPVGKSMKLKDLIQK